MIDWPMSAFRRYRCEGGGGGFICGAAWDRNSTIRATTIDLVKGRVISRFKAYSHGRRVVLLPLPMYFPAAVEGEACKALGKTLAEEFSGEPEAEAAPEAVEIQPPVS